MPLKTFIYRHRLVGKRAIAFLARALPASASRRLRAMAERVAFSVTPQYQADTLPPIFHYWSGRFLEPSAQRLGVGSPEAFFLDHIRRRALGSPQTVRVLSTGTGACAMEVGLAELLQAEGLRVQITCLDFNPALMRSAAALAHERGVDALMRFVTCDCNQPFELEPQDVIIVNQFFHHVTELEIFCRSLRSSLAPHGILLSSDIIGRNGHQLWPDVETVVQQTWATLLPAQRYDRHFDAVPEHYRPIDHAAYSNEGVRAQDVVACLLDEFDFELFFSFGAAIVPFIERRIGFNFDPSLERDRAVIERVHSLDAAALEAGSYPAANMIASLRHKGLTTQAMYEPISPQRHVELTRQQRMKVASRAWPRRSNE